MPGRRDRIRQRPTQECSIDDIFYRLTGGQVVGCAALVAGAAPTGTGVPGPGAADGVTVRKSVCQGWSRYQLNVPPSVAFWNPFMSSTVAAVKGTSVVGPLYVVDHWTNGQ